MGGSRTKICSKVPRDLRPATGWVTALYHSLINTSTNKQKRIWSKCLKKCLTKTYGQGNVRSEECLSVEMSGRRSLYRVIFRSGNCPFREMSVGELSFGEVSVGDLSSRKCQSRKCPVGECLHIVEHKERGLESRGRKLNEYCIYVLTLYRFTIT